MIQYYQDPPIEQHPQHHHQQQLFNSKQHLLQQRLLISTHPSTPSTMNPLNAHLPIPIVVHTEKKVTIPADPAELVDTSQLIDWIQLVTIDRIRKLSPLAVKDTEAWCRDMKMALQEFVDLREFIPRIVHNEYSHVSPAVSLLL